MMLQTSQRKIIQPAKLKKKYNLTYGIYEQKQCSPFFLLHTMKRIIKPKRLTILKWTILFLMRQLLSITLILQELIRLSQTIPFSTITF